LGPRALAAARADLILATEESRAAVDRADLLAAARRPLRDDGIKTAVILRYLPVLNEWANVGRLGTGRP
jgi:hypothetical protein